MHSCCDRPILRLLRERGFLRRGDFLASLGAALAAAGCSGSLPAYNPPNTTLPNQQVVLLNGNVITLAGGGAGHRTTAVAIGGSRILATAADGNELRQRYPQARVFDLQGATLVPGFIEAHAHISQVLLDLICHDLSGVHSLDDLLTALRNLLLVTPPGKWLYGQGVDTSLMVPHYRPPTIEQLDAISSTTPIFIEDSTGHLYYVNHAALAQSVPQVTPGQRFPAGGLVGGNHDGIEGIIYEFAIGPFFPDPPEPTAAQLSETIFNLLKLAQSNGVTTWHDPAAGLFTGHIDKDMAIYQGIAENPNTPLRIMSSVILTDVSQNGALLRHPRAKPGDGFFYDAAQTLWVPSLKIWVDGTPQGETAAMKEKYISHPPTTGFAKGRLDWHSKRLREHLALARRNGWSVLMHVNGDAAIDQALDAVETIFGSPLPDSFRVRFEHCTVSRPEQFDRMKAIGITPTFLNNHTYIWGDAFKDRIIGPERANRLDAAGDCVSRGIPFSFHCDYGVSQPQPLRYMQTAVTRRTRHGTPLGEDLKISPLEALRAVTIYPAMQLNFDHRIGSIEPGKDADFAELAQDPLTVPHDSIANIPVRATWKMGTRLPATRP